MRLNADNGSRHKSLLTEIKEKSGNGKNAVDLDEILRHKHGADMDLLRYREAFELFADGYIDIEPHRRVPNLQQVVLLGENAKSRISPGSSISKAGEWLSAYIRNVPVASMEEFHELTGSKLGNHELFGFLNRINSGIDDLKILLRTIAGFIAGRHPVFLSDIADNAVELAHYTALFNDGESVLLNQDLLKTRIDPDGITCSLALTRRALELIQNKSISLLPGDSHAAKGFCTYIRHDSIRERKLFFSGSAMRILENFEKLLATGSHDASTSVSLLLYGPSGTGKTEFAKQAAKSAGANILQVNYAQIHSKWIGETEKNIRKVFAAYEDTRRSSRHPVILLLNEADGLMNRRVNIHTSNDVFANQAQSQMLEELETFKGILIATTNLYQNIDEAFHRRFLFQCLLDYPDADTRRLLLQQSSVGKYLSPEALGKLQELRWTAAQLQNIERKLSHFALLQPLSKREVMAMMEQDGLIQPSRKIGFR